MDRGPGGILRGPIVARGQRRRLRSPPSGAGALDTAAERCEFPRMLRPRSPMRSLRGRLSLVVLLATAASLALGLLSFRAAREEATLRAERVEASLDLACDRVRALSGFVASGLPAGTVMPNDRAFAGDMRAVLAVALRGTRAIQGGVWRQGDAGGGGGGATVASWDDGATSASGSGPSSGWAALAARSAIASGSAVTLRAKAPLRILVACPLAASAGVASAWLSATPASGAGGGTLALSLALLGALVLTIVLLLGGALLAWSRGIARIEAALDRDVASGALPVLAPSGERELDRVVGAINAASARLAGAQARAQRAERLAFVGSVASGIAHEIRNPVAAMRLRAENALAQAATDARRRRALDDSLVQIGRIEALVSELLALASPRPPAPVPTGLRDFLAARLVEHEEVAAASAIALVLGETDPTLRVPLDPVLFGRALDNLVGNALRHARSSVCLSAARDAFGGVRITVRDDGPGVAAALRSRLFQPFATGRADGVGLGLAIARDIADAHGATIGLAANGPDGACFEVAWPPS